MAQFIAYENPNRETRKTYPYLLDIQTNLLSELRTTIVIPLCPASLAGNAAITKLCPSIEINNKTYVALTQQMAGVSRKFLSKEVCDLSSSRPDIIAALDLLISGI